jgi:hypothetical protein
MSESGLLARQCSDEAQSRFSADERMAMHYTLLLYQSPNDFAARNDPKKREAFLGSFVPYMKAMRDAGIVVGGAGLQPPQVATSVKQRDGQRQVQDGPFADTKEQLGGFFIIDVPDLDTALDWASRFPTEGGGVEVRPNMPPLE